MILGVGLVAQYLAETQQVDVRYREIAPSFACIFGHFLHNYNAFVVFLRYFHEGIVLHLLDVAEHLLDRFTE